MADSEIRRVLREQVEDLRRLQDEEAEALLLLLEDSRRELRERMEAAARRLGMEAFTSVHLAAVSAEVEAAVQQLRVRMTRRLDRALEGAERRALADLVDLVERKEPDFRGIVPRLETRLTLRIGERAGLRLHEWSVHRYGTRLIDGIQGELVAAVAQHKTLDETVAGITRQDSALFAELRGRAETIARTELSSAYNAEYAEEIADAAEALDGPDGRPDDPLLKRDDEYIDQRTHPISYVLDGMVVPPDEPFRVSVAEVQAVAARIKRPAGGILWPQVGAYYEGQTLPAHFNERGRIHAWRRSWDPDLPVKTPPPR